MQDYKKKNLINNKGITGIDLVIALVMIVTFTGLLVGLMSGIYKNSVEIQKSANATAYATIILEKVDEKAFENVTENFIIRLKSSGEISIDETEYTYEFSVSPIENIDENLIKQVTLKVKYDINGEEKILNFSKLKIKEVYKDTNI